MKKETRTVNINGVDLTVEGYWEGKNIPATRYDPEEFANFVITKVTTDKCILDLLSEYDMEQIYEQIEE